MIDKRKAVFFDIDTQYDFMDPNGALYVPGAEEIVDNLKRLVEFARSNGIVVVATADAHLQNDPEFDTFPPHCIKGTDGQRKIEATAMQDPFVVEFGYLGDIPPDRKEYLIEKRTYSFFSNSRADELLRALGRTQAVVFGVATDYCVRSAVEGLMDRGWDVHLVIDAIKPVDEEAERILLDSFQKRGVKLIRTADITG